MVSPPSLGHQLTRPPLSQIAYSERLNIVAKGAAVKGGKILPLGAYWGEDMIVTSPALRDTRPATALTYCKLGTLSRADFEAVRSQSRSA